MPPVRNRLLGRKQLLAVTLGLSILLGMDALRPPQNQVSVYLFALSIDGYHRYLHPLTGRFIHCRYQPTCSSYAVQAIRKYGIAKGAWLTVRRIGSCRSSVPMGTRDPVPVSLTDRWHRSRS